MAVRADPDRARRREFESRCQQVFNYNNGVRIRRSTVGAGAYDSPPESFTFHQRFDIISPKGGGVMKKTMYYFSPFVIFPFVFLILPLLESTDVLKPIVPYVMFATLLLSSVVIGILSPAKTKFDYIMAAAVPSSLLLSVFIALFFDEGCDGMPQLSLHHALNIEYYKAWLPIALIMMVITFIVSFKPVRNIVSNKFAYRKSEK